MLTAIQALQVEMGGRQVNYMTMCWKLIQVSPEDSEENECNANGSKEDDSSFHLEENLSDAASGAKVAQGLVYSDDEAYLFEVESEDETRTSFPKDLGSKNIIPGGPTKPDVRNMSEATAKNVLKA